MITDGLGNATITTTVDIASTIFLGQHSFFLNFPTLGSEFVTIEVRKDAQETAIFYESNTVPGGIENEL